MVTGSWLMAQGWLGAWPGPQGLRERGGLRPWPLLFPAPPPFLSHEPLTINNRLINRSIMNWYGKWHLMQNNTNQMLWWFVLLLLPGQYESPCRVPDIILVARWVLGATPCVPSGPRALALFGSLADWWGGLGDGTKSYPFAFFC